MERFLRRALILAASLLCLLFIPNALVSLNSDGESECYGSPSNGRLEDGVRLSTPRWMRDEVRSYCPFCELLLRTYVHSDVATVVHVAYTGVGYDGFVNTDWVHGETGWPWGGSFRPHRTHKNGLSVDFMAPLKDGARFPTHPFNRFGYDEEFDENGNGAAGKIDFRAMGSHLASLLSAAQEAGGGIRRVILAPDLQDDLFAARADHAGVSASIRGKHGCATTIIITWISTFPVRRSPKDRP